MAADSALVFGCVIVVFLTLCVVQGSTDPPSPADPDVAASGTTPDPDDYNNSNITQNVSCDQVRQVYAMKQIGLGEDVPDTMINGSGLAICSSSLSCCTDSMENNYKDVVKRDFRNMLQASNSFLKTLLASSAAKLSDNFLEMVHVSQNNTNVLFSEVYKKMDTVAKAPVSQLYSDLSGYVAGQDLDLEKCISTFFDLLFPLVFHHSINPKLKDFSDDYKECLRQTQHEIRPFGDIPSRISLQISRSFVAARTLLHALHLGVEVISTTDHMDLTEECAGGLTRLTYCAHCQGYVMAKPCNGYCLNVVRGCLSTVAELDQSWSDFVSSLERLTAGLVSTYNIEEVLSMLDTKISEAIMYAMENGPELSKKVKVACGHPRRATRDVSEPAAMGAPGRIVPVRTSENSLYVRLQMLVQRLSETKGQYANMADVLCSDDSWAVREEGQCWNGQELGQYTKTIAGIGIAAQRYNPEMESPKTEDLVVSALETKLKLMSKGLVDSITTVPQSDSYMIEGSGSGAWARKNSIGDDEDYENGSGSGDSGGTRSTDFEFDTGATSNQDINIKVKGNGGDFVRSSSSLVALLFLVCSLIQKWFYITTP